MSIIVRDATLCSFIIFLQTALHVSDDTVVHHQEHTVITTSGTGRTVFATVCWRGGVVPSPPRQRTKANTVRPVPDVVITGCICSWWWMRLSSKTCRAVCRKYNKICIQSHLVEQLLTLIHDAQTDEHKYMKCISYLVKATNETLWQLSFVQILPSKG